VLSIVGALPFWISGEIPSYVDAFFETVSGFTTTGSSIVSNVEGLSHGMLFWRSLTQWVGGMGVLVLIMAIMPTNGGYGIHLLRAESPGPNVGKLVPKIRETAMILYGIYFAITVVETILLLITRMPVFDAFTISMSTASTGGFGVLNDSCASYTIIQQWIITIFMILFGVNFTFYFLLFIRRQVSAFKIDEIRYYFGIILGSIILIAVSIRSMYNGWEETLRHASFQVGTIITTTGFSTTDFDLWPQFAKSILLLLMFIGACSGSTSGGIKVSRILIMAKSLKNEISSMLHSRSVKRIRMDGHTIENSVVKSVHIFLIAYAMVFILSFLVVSLDNMDMETTASAVAATLNNIGPGFKAVGPSQNFEQFSALSKLVLSFDMLAGRLELFPLLLLFHPSAWKKF
jgi:trk system potassium uptake protein TrkH